MNIFGYKPVKGDSKQPKKLRRVIRRDRRPGSAPGAWELPPAQRDAKKIEAGVQLDAINDGASEALAVLSEPVGTTSKFTFLVETLPKKIAAVVGLLELGWTVYKYLRSSYYARYGDKFVSTSVEENTMEFRALKDWASNQIVLNEGSVKRYMFELTANKNDAKQIVLEDLNMIPFKGKFVTINKSDSYDEAKSRWNISIPEAVLVEFYEEFNRIYALNGERCNGIFAWSGWRWSRVCNLPMERHVIMPKGVMESVVHDAKRFLGAREWYESKGIPWRRGYLLYGVPGGGKTSLIVALAITLKKNLYVISTKDCLNGFQDALRALPEGAIVLIEDVDSLFESSREVMAGSNYERIQLDNKLGTAGVAEDDDPDPTKETSLSLSDFLNAVDGVTAFKGGRILVLTTNHKDSLDKAVIRKGRVDVEVEFTYANDDQLLQLSNRMLGEDEGPAFFLKTFAKREPTTMAEAENILLVEALEIFNAQTTGTD